MDPGLPTQFGVSIGVRSRLQRLRLQLLDLDVAFHSNSAAALAMLRRMYSRFVVVADRPSDPACQRLCVHLRVADSPAHGSHTLRIGGDAWQVPAHCPPDTLYDLLLHKLLSRVRSHIVLHAGVVARGGQATLLVGESGFGKTTLALELVRRGYRFLSDEFAAIHRATGEVDPFPRTLRLRPDTLARVGALPLEPAGEPWQGKHLVDIEHLWPGCAGTRARIHHVVLLGGDHGPAPEAGRRTVLLGASRPDGALLAALRRVDGVAAVAARPHPHTEWVALEADVAATALPGVEACCRQHGGVILDVVKRTPAAPDFGRPPALTPIPHSQMLLAMVRAFQATHHSQLVVGPGHSAGRLVAELARLTRTVRAYRLRPGDLRAAADLIEDLSTGETIDP